MVEQLPTLQQQLINILSGVNNIPQAERLPLVEKGAASIRDYFANVGQAARDNPLDFIKREGLNALIFGGVGITGKMSFKELLKLSNKMFKEVGVGKIGRVPLPRLSAEGRELTFIKNPSKNELEAFMKRENTDFVRGIKTPDGDVIYSDGLKSIHNDLGLITQGSGQDVRFGASIDLVGTIKNGKLAIEGLRADGKRFPTGNVVRSVKKDNTTGTIVPFSKPKK